MTVRLGAGLAVAVVLLGGCASGTTTGSAQPSGGTSSTPSVQDMSYDPCTQVTDTMITALGLDPATKGTYEFGAGKAMEIGCRWKDSPTMTRLSTDIGKNATPLDRFRTNPTYNGVTELTIGGHPAINFVTDTAGGGCNLAIEITGGTAIVATSAASQTAGAPDPDSCPDAERIATAIAPLFP